MFDRATIIEDLEKLVGYSEDIPRGVTGDLVATDPFSQVDKKHPLIIHKNIEAAKVVEESYPDYLRRIRQESILEAVQDLFDYKSINKSVKQTLTDVKGIFGDRLAHETAGFLEGNFVGHRIRANKYGSRAVFLNRIGLNLLNDQEGLDIYVFKGENFDRDNPYAKFTLNYSGKGYKWSDVNARLTFVEERETYYIGYFEDDLGTNTYLTRPFDFTKSCGSCSPHDHARFTSWNKYIGVFPIKMNPGTEEIVGTNKKTYGLNLSFTVECDVTATLLSNRRQIARLAVEKMVIRHLNELVNTNEINKISDRSRSLASMALEGSITNTGSRVKGTGLLHKYIEIVEQASFELSGIGDDCLHCDKTSGILRWT